MKNRVLLLLVLFVLASPSDSGDRIYLIHADKLEQKNIKGKRARILEGNVHVTKGRVNIFCQRVIWYEEENLLILKKDVKITEEKQTLSCQEVRYLTDVDKIVAGGNPILVSEENSLSADSITYLVKQKEAFAKGHVFLKSKDRVLESDFVRYDVNNKVATTNTKTLVRDIPGHTELFSDSLVYNYSTEKIHAYRNPVLIKADSSGNRIFRITGSFILGDEKENFFISIGHVKITKENIIATCDTAEYHEKEQLAFLKGAPRIKQGRRIIKGREIHFQLEEDEIRTIEVIEQAEILSHGFAYLPAVKDSIKSDTVPTVDRLMGRFVKAFLRDNDLDSLIVKEMAVSYYNILEDSVIKGLNITSGDSIMIKISQGKVKRVTVSGGTEGRFVPHKTNTQVDTTVLYSAGEIRHSLDNKISYLIENARIDYGNMSLTAGYIKIDWKENKLYALPLRDTLTDSLSSIPTFTQKGREPLFGEMLEYNIKTQRGRIYRGKSRMQEGIYYGEKIKKTGRKTFYVRQGIYTTCDLPEHPHYYFKSEKMKIIHQDKIIAKPIVLYIYDIPIIALPFGVFPSKKGRRHSGWIMPTYGDDRRNGGFIKGLGYFWAPNDYYDVRLTTDFYDKIGVIVGLRIRYAWRYRIPISSIEAIYTNKFLSYLPEKNWTVRINHRQILSPTASLLVSGSFVSSDSYLRKYSIDKNRRLQQNLISNATFSKKWPGKPYSLSANLRETRFLLAPEKAQTPPTYEGEKINYIQKTLPAISFTHSQKQLFPSKDKAKSKWYNNVYYSFKSLVKSTQSIYYLAEKDTLDSLFWKKRINTSSYMTNNISISSSQRLFKYFSTNQQISIDHSITSVYYLPEIDSAGNFITENGKIKKNEVKALKGRVTGRTSFSLRTKLYGLFPITIGPIRAVRHVVTPSLSYSYTPDLSKKVFLWTPGYILQDAQGRKFDIFYGTPIGSTPQREIKTLSFSVSNAFQAKIAKGKEEKAFEFLTVSSSGSYNFTLDSLRLSTISTYVRSRLSNKLSLNISLRHDFYKYAGRRINEINTNKRGIPIPRLLSVSLSTGFSLSDSYFSKQEQDIEGDSRGIFSAKGSDRDSLKTFLSRDKKEGRKLWDATFRVKFSIDKTNPEAIRKRFWTNARLQFKVFNWKVNYSADIDVFNRKIVGQSISLSRDLHCWEFYFSWVPSGYGKQYYLRINVKSPTLRDLKYEERGGRRRSYGF